MQPQDEYPRREEWGTDTGIDLLTESVLGETWSIQAKAFDAGATVPLDQVSTSISKTARPEIGLQPLLTTAADASAHARRHFKDLEKPFAILTRDSLLDLGLPDEIGLADLRAARAAPERHKPRPNQARAIADVLEGFRAHDRGQLIQACGTGKTLTALWVKKRLGCQRTAVFVPSLSLAGQFLRDWSRHATEPFTSIVVCSDQTVTDRGDNAMVGSVADIGLPATTDANVVRVALPVVE